MNNEKYCALINTLDEIIYVSDLSTYELLFANEFCRNLLTDPDYKGKKCYAWLHDRTAPCSFCPNSLLTKETSYVWENFDSQLNRHFLIQNKLIDWNGRLSNIGAAVDITSHDKFIRDARGKLRTERTLVSCIRSLTAAKDLDSAINTMLSAIGGYYQSDRCFILELDSACTYCSNTFEWCAPGAVPQMQFLKERQVELHSFWSKAVERRSTVILETEELRESAPKDYERLIHQDIQRLMAVPFFLADGGIGYLGIDNPHYNERNPALLQSLTYFIVSEIYSRRMEQTLKYQSSHDSLTGLYNRLHYNRYAESTEPGKLASLGLVFCDINGLKHTNDTLGHLQGDQVIIQTGQILNREFPNSQVYRLSGDEFTVLCPDVDRNTFANLTSNVQKQFIQSGISISIGSEWSDAEIDITKMTRIADERMYSNKQHYYKSVRALPLHRKADHLITLLTALEDGRYEMYLQPKADIHTREIIGAEALTRYHDPVRGLVPPDKFIPFLETERIISHLDLFIFEEACKALATWKLQGLKLIPISVNFSRNTVTEAALTEHILTILSRYPIPRKLIEIEITESVGNVEHQLIADFSAKLKSHGLLVSLDDFGASYCSMSMLTVMEPDILKLDRSLIKNLTSNPKSRILVHRILELCQDLQIKSIAEGVETPDQLSMLDDLNCNLAQGFLFGRPVTLGNFEQQFMR